MADNKQTSDVKALQKAIIERAQELTDEHIAQGKNTRTRIMKDARDKVKLMESKEILLAQEESERSYQKSVQSREIQLQAELDRIRWSLVQQVMSEARKQLQKLMEDPAEYQKIFTTLLVQGAKYLDESVIFAQVNSQDHARLKEQWASITQGLTWEITLADETCQCSGGVQLFSSAADKKVDNTFEGIMQRKQEELMQVTFKHLFAKIQSIGGTTHG